MTEFKVKGQIEKILDVQSGTSKAGKAWKSQEFILKTDSEYNNTYCFVVFGDRVDNLTKYNKIGDVVTVQFNVNVNEYQGKYYTSLGAYRIEGANKEAITNTPEQIPDNTDEILPF